MQDKDTSEELTSEERAFHDGYNNTLQFLENRANLTNLKLGDLEGELHHLTIYEGQDWGGRGELKNSEIQGQIYAYLAVIDSLKKENKPERG
ncbi:MAG TPA: hypothetical protein GXZ69_04245 [Spirochaetales bacterium]|jgi:hypothetical protein|nr:hypothetical protein [Spirochaetales bacterium]